MMERPIIFSGSMIRAILEGRKTQTRRVVKPQPYVDVQGNACWNEWCYGQNTRGEPHIQALASPLPVSGTGKVRCPYGRPGDRLWVREAFSGPHCMEASEGCAAAPPSKWGRSSRIWYWAHGNPDEGDWTRPRPSIHMPRWASRILLEITDVRVERVQDISDDDCESEGIRQRWTCINPGTGSYAHGNDVRDDFRKLWDSINTKRGLGWNTNPWTWVLTFKRMTEAAG